MCSKIALIACGTYDEDLVYDKVKEGLELLGGIGAFVNPNEHVLLKPNLVRKAQVERAVITHPHVVGAVARILREAGCTNISCGDSCGIGMADKVMDGTGMDTLLKKYEVEIRNFSEGESVRFEQGIQAKHFVLSKPALEADAIINLCKMKTHALERITGAVKNLYGCVYGLNKAKGHTMYPSADSFARMLIDLNRLLKPRLHIMDGIIAMEGNGPTSGDPVLMNVILISADPVALDSVYSSLIYLKPSMVPTIYHGEKMGLGTADTETIEIVTPEGTLNIKEAVSRYGRADFKVDRRRIKADKWVKMGRVLNLFQKKPYIVQDKCIRCGICAECCPVDTKAVAFSNGRQNPPVYDYKKCIRCFCCQEMCPNKAIETGYRVKARGF